MLYYSTEEMHILAQHGNNLQLYIAMIMTMTTTLSENTTHSIELD